MAFNLKNEKEAREYFEKCAKTCSPSSVILFHNQRNKVLEIIRDTAGKAEKAFIEQDLSTLSEERIGTSRFENKVPAWIAPVFDPANKTGSLLYLREFHFAGDRVKTDAMNLILKREVEASKLPDNVLIILGLLDIEDAASGLANTHSVIFYRQP